MLKRSKLFKKVQIPKFERSVVAHLVAGKILRSIGYSGIGIV